ncbi:uncharacterized protein DS421_9g263810 [Arachis hypogaea]|nr:uncharacterized protein DS421_9g263810 [Arachis hypogaea]
MNNKQNSNFSQVTYLRVVVGATCKGGAKLLGTGCGWLCAIVLGCSVREEVLGGSSGRAAIGGRSAAAASGVILRRLCVRGAPAVGDLCSVREEEGFGVGTSEEGFEVVGGTWVPPASRLKDVGQSVAGSMAGWWVRGGRDLEKREAGLGFDWGLGLGTRSAAAVAH